MGLPAIRRARSDYPGTYRGLNREDSLPEVAWRHRRGADAGVRVGRVRLPVLQPGDAARSSTNFWGYNPVAFAAPKAAFAASAKEHAQTHEFRDMVKAMHAAGIEVILDVVFNHTGEGDDRGRTFSFRGLDNELLLPARRPRPLPELLRRAATR